MNNRERLRRRELTLRRSVSRDRQTSNGSVVRSNFSNTLKKIAGENTLARTGPLLSGSLPLAVRKFLQLTTRSPG